MAQRFAPGTLLIDRYLIDSYHNAGGMQEVYRCHDISLDRPAVVKTPKDGVKDRRFRRGAEMGARVNHPNIAATYDYYEDEDVTFLVEEFVPGRDLGRRLSSDYYFLDPGLAAHVVHHIARALHEAHRAEICHRDLKPSNVMVSDDASLYTIKLTDFGIAKLAESAIATEMSEWKRDEATLTTSSTLLGAVPYMAPECWSDWKSAGQPMDIWALGCIAYQLLSGNLPFGGGAVAIANVVRAEAAGIVNLQKPATFGTHASTIKLESDIWALVLSCIALDPANRPSAKQVIEACDALCYSSSERMLGEIIEYGIPYDSGVKRKTGRIRNLVSKSADFFHGSEFYGSGIPKVGQKVSYSVYPGAPWDRCSPVLLLR